MAIGLEDGSVRLLDLRPENSAAALGRHVAEVFGARFTPDGHTLVTTGADSDVILWDVRRAAARETLSGQAGRVPSPQITRDGGPLTAGPGGAVFIWDLDGIGASAGRSAPARPANRTRRSRRVRPSSRSAPTVA